MAVERQRKTHSCAKSDCVSRLNRTGCWSPLSHEVALATAALGHVLEMAGLGRVSFSLDNLEL